MHANIKLSRLRSASYGYTSTSKVAKKSRAVFAFKGCVSLCAAHHYSRGTTSTVTVQHCCGNRAVKVTISEL